MIGLRVQHMRMTAARATGRDLLGPAMLVLIGGAWLSMLVAQLTSGGSLVHQHGAAATTLPTWLALWWFLVSWQVMVVATMLPASLPSIRLAATAVGDRLRPRRSAVTFLAGFASVWTAAGLAAFVAGQAVERSLGPSPWLEARPWLVQASVIALAGVYQLTPIKRDSLAACRHPDPRLADSPSDQATLYAIGLRHGFACLGSAWALMAVMIVAGFGDLWWMAALAGVMVYEATGRHGQRLATMVGLLLVWLSALVLLPGWLPA